MSESTRRVLISCIVIVVVVCLCLSLISIVGGLGILFYRNNPFSFNLPRQNPTPQENASLTEDEIEKQMAEIQTQVSKFRGLNPSTSVVRSLLTSDQLRQHVTDDFLKTIRLKTPKMM